jgi:hypothetical protein
MNSMPLRWFRRSHHQPAKRQGVHARLRGLWRLRPDALDIRRANDLGPLFGLVGDQLAELGKIGDRGSSGSTSERVRDVTARNATIGGLVVPEAAMA